MVFLSKLVRRAIIGSRSIYTNPTFTGDDKTLRYLKKLQYDYQLTGCSITGSRTIYTTSVFNGDERTLQKLKSLQAHYQKEDGQPIWLKAGLRDRILWTITVIACASGLVQTFYTLFKFASPPSWKVEDAC